MICHNLIYLLLISMCFYGCSHYSDNSPTSTGCTSLVSLCNAILSFHLYALSYIECRHFCCFINICNRFITFINTLFNKLCFHRGLSDPFCGVYVGRQRKFLTNVKKETLNPVWNEQCTIEMPKDDETLHVVGS